MIRGMLTPEEYEKLLKRIEADPARWRPARERALPGRLMASTCFSWGTGAPTLICF